MFWRRKKKRTILLENMNGTLFEVDVEDKQCGRVAAYNTVLGSPRMVLLAAGGEFHAESFLKRWHPASGWSDEELQAMGMTAANTNQTQLRSERT